MRNLLCQKYIGTFGFNLPTAQSPAAHDTLVSGLAKIIVQRSRWYHGLTKMIVQRSHKFAGFSL